MGLEEHNEQQSAIYQNEYEQLLQENMQLKEKAKNLHHVCLELSGVISEYRAMPCKSLQDCMFDTELRYRKRISENQP